MVTTLTLSVPIELESINLRTMSGVAQQAMEKLKKMTIHK